MRHAPRACSPQQFLTVLNQYMVSIYLNYRISQGANRVDVVAHINKSPAEINGRHVLVILLPYSWHAKCARKAGLDSKSFGVMWWTWWTRKPHTTHSPDQPPPCTLAVFATEREERVSVRLLSNERIRTQSHAGKKRPCGPCSVFLMRPCAAVCDPFRSHRLISFQLSLNIIQYANGTF
jgi:hypothetical protein